MGFALSTIQLKSLTFENNGHMPSKHSNEAEGTSQFTQGLNNFGNTGYNGPLPPEGHGLHHYYFWILALDKQTDLKSGLTLWELLESIEPNILGMNRLVGIYQR